MPKVAFWSPDEGMSGLTHTVIAVSTLMGVMHKTKCLVMDTNEGPLKIESSYVPYDSLMESKVNESTNIGLGALTKIIASNKLTPSVIQNYAKPILKDKLDILYNTLSNKEDQYKIIKENLSLIISKAELAYDLVLIDLIKNKDEKCVKEVLQDADVVVCISSQNSIKFKNFFELDKDKVYLKNKPIINVLGSYNDASKYNAKNLKRKYGFKEELYVVPYNINFLDACNSRRNN